MNFKEQINISKEELRGSRKRLRKKKYFKSVLVRFPFTYYTKLKEESNTRKIPMTKLLLEKLSKCNWNNKE